MKYYHIQRKIMNKTNFWEGDVLNTKYHKICNGLLHDKEIIHMDKFGKDKYTKDGKRTICIACEDEYDQTGRNEFMKWFNRQRQKEKKSKWEFEIEPTDIPGVEGYFDRNIGRGQWIITKWPKYCHATGKKLNWSMERNDETRNRDNIPSLDRYDPKIHYRKGNVRITTWRYNTIKNDLTKKEMAENALYFLKDSGMFWDEIIPLIGYIKSKEFYISNVNQLNLFDSQFKNIESFCE